MKRRLAVRPMRRRRIEPNDAARSVMIRACALGRLLLAFRFYHHDVEGSGHFAADRHAQRLEEVGFFE